VSERKETMTDNLPDITDDLYDISDMPKDLQADIAELLISGDLIAVTLTVKGDSANTEPTTLVYKPGDESAIGELADWLTEFDNRFSYVIYQP
jgi:hypothetical protein